jgi:hypothetical protein
MNDSQSALKTARRALAVSFVALGLVGAFYLGGAVSQSAGATTSTLTFCIDKKTAIIAQRTKCKSTEKVQLINVSGQIGPQGPAGPKGDTAIARAYNFTAQTPGAEGAKISTDDYTPLPAWSLPTTGDYLVTQQFVVNAFPVDPSHEIKLECFVGDINGYFSAVSITAVPNPHVPAGVTTFNTGYGSVTYLAHLGAVNPFCRNLSSETETYVASYPATMVPVTKAN